MSTDGKELSIWGILCPCCLQEYGTAKENNKLHKELEAYRYNLGNVLAMIFRDGGRKQNEIDDNKKAVELAIDEVCKLRNELEMVKCCGNCHWNKGEFMRDKCDLGIWLNEKTNRGRGICENWKAREK